TDFTFEKGSSNFAGDFNLNDNSYSTFTADDSYHSFDPDPQSSQAPQYISSTTRMYGFVDPSYNDLTTTYSDDPNFYQINGEDAGVNDYTIDFTFNFNPSLSGDYFINYKIVTSDGVSGVLNINGQTYQSGTTLEVNNNLVRGLTSISYNSYYQNPIRHNVKVYYFKIVKADSDFAISKGTSDGLGDLSIMNNDFTTFVADVPTATVTLYPNADGSPLEWAPTVGTHFDRVQSDDTNYIFSPGTLSGRVERIRFDEFSIGDGIVFTIRVKILSRRDYSTPYLLKLQVVNGYTSSTVNVWEGDGVFSWKTYTWSGLSLTQVQLNNIEVELTAYDDGDNPEYINVDQLIIEIDYTDMGEREVYFGIKMQLDSFSSYPTTDKVLSYAYKTTDNTPIQIRFKIYNFVTSVWEEVDYTDHKSFFESTQPLTSSQIDTDGTVYLKMNAWTASDRWYDFNLYLDLLRIDYENHTLSFEASILTDSVFGKNLYYSYRTDIPQSLQFSIWDYSGPTPHWTTISDANSTDFTEHSIPLTSNYFDAIEGVKFKFWATNDDAPFKLEIDSFYIHSWAVTEEETTGVEDYFISIT
ncbi:hypothetical protein LCGC14_2292800, partial [marine sediment metagenome]